MSLLIALPVLLALTPSAYAQWCYDGYGYRYRCNNSGLSYGARIGIGLGVAVAVLAVFGLCGYWRRRQIQNQFKRYRPPTLPVSQNDNPYANNPPPPSNWNSNSYTSNLPPPPPQTYQPSMAGQYGNKPEGNHEHGYEWEQAREQERLEREQASANAPPGYDVASSAHNTGIGAGYAPPPGPPPERK